jgi:PHD/YefM family antitoxin component YafN of YafNO toxin-antitoxin module
MHQKIISLSKAKAKLLEIARTVDDYGEAFIFTKDGEPIGAFIPMNEYESYLETSEIMADRNLMKDLKEALAQEKKGQLFRRTKLGKWVKAK